MLYQIKSDYEFNFIIASFFWWCGAGSNRRHKDFQSFALPTELPHHWDKMLSCPQTPVRGSKNRAFASFFYKISGIISLPFQPCFSA